MEPNDKKLNRRTSLRWIALGSLVAFAAGLAIGYFLRPAFRTDGIEPKQHPEVVRAESELSEETQRLQRQLANTRAVIAEQEIQIAELENAQDEQGKLQSEALLAQTLVTLENLNIYPAFDPTLLLTPEFAKALQITDEEATEIQSILIRFENEVRMFETENIELISKEGDTEIFRIPAFPEMGSRMRERITTEISQILGEARSEFLLNKSDRQLDRTFNYFGLNQRVITINPTDEKFQNPGYSYIIEQFQDSTGKTVSSRTKGFREGDLPALYRHLFDSEQ